MKTIKDKDPSKILIIFIIASILIVNLVITNLIVYSSMKNIIKESIIENELSLSNKLIYQEIHQELYPIISVSRDLSKDLFIKSWLVDKNSDDSFMIDYLKSVRDAYNFSTCFLVSKTKSLYYNFNGAYPISSDDSSASWYYDFIESNDIMNIKIDINKDMNNLTTVFINYKIFDENNKLLGVTGVGLDFNSIPLILTQYGDDYQRDLYFVNFKGEVIERSKKCEILFDNIFEIKELKNKNYILNENSSMLIEYDTNNTTNILYSRYLEEFDWWIISIQKESQALDNVEHVLSYTIIIHSISIILTLLLCAIVINLFQNKLRKLAKTDVLTNINNRNSFNSSFEKALFKKRRFNEDSSLILIDIDKFKEINDIYGHLIGDEVLVKFAQLLKKSLKTNDVPFRWGGDEFLIISYNSFPHDAKLLSQKIIDSLNEIHIYTNNTRVSFTISIGISNILENDNQDFVFKRADTAMYKAKKDGRNKIVLFDDQKI